MNHHPGPWHILTGEYPPQVGGVADYSRQVAHGLANAGADVHVWAPLLEANQVDEVVPGLTVHREASGWSPDDLDRISLALDQFQAPRRILLQYVPNTFGRWGLNLGLARFLASRRRKSDTVRVMFHEVTYIVKPGDGVIRQSLAWAQRRLVTRLLGAADQVDVAIPYWMRMLEPLDPVSGRIYTWIPVASNVPVVDDPLSIKAIRGDQASTRIGSFGTFASDGVAMLAKVMIPLLLDHPDRVAVLIGQGGKPVAETWVNSYPQLAGQVMATGMCSLADLSRYLQSCDVLLQPYPGGVCSKRTTMMAGLAHGLATITTSGEVTEPIWSETQATAIAPENDPAMMIALAESLLSDPLARSQLIAAGQALYEKRFALCHTLEALMGEGLRSTLTEKAFT